MEKGFLENQDYCTFRAAFVVRMRGIPSPNLAEMFDRYTVERPESDSERITTQRTRFTNHHNSNMFYGCKDFSASLLTIKTSPKLGGLYEAQQSLRGRRVVFQ